MIYQYTGTIPYEYDQHVLSAMLDLLQTQLVVPNTYDKIDEKRKWFGEKLRTNKYLHGQIKYDAFN